MSEPMTSPHAPRFAGAVPLLLILGLAAAVIASLCVGAYPMSSGHAFRILLHPLWPWASHPAWDLREITVMAVIRPPRVLVAALAGIGLGISGAALQGMMRNPLVGPDLVGVTSGAALGGVIAIELGWSSAALVVLASGCGLAAMACTFGFAKLVHARSDGIALILAGFFVGAFCLAGVGLVEYLDPRHAGPGIVYWLLGPFRGADPTKVWTIAIPTGIGGAVLMGLRWRLNLLSLGDLDAASLGVNVKRLRWIVIAVVSFIVASQVAVSGIVAWIGLIVPHCARMLVGPDHRRLLPVSALLGGLLTLGLDDFTRSIVRGELPVGILAALIGTPLICFLFWKTQTRGWSKD